MSLRREMVQDTDIACSRPWKPHDGQKKGVQFMLGRCGSGLFLNPGMGKTSVMLKVLQTLKQQGMMRRALVIAPLRPCYLVWPAEMRKWTDFHDLRYVILHGSRKEMALDADADVYIINPDGLPWLTEDGRIERLSPDVLVVDESSKFRNTRTQRFSLLRPWLNKFKRRHILTGSPAPKSYLDLFGQIYILDCGSALGQYVTHYRKNYFYQTGYMGYDWSLQEGAEKRIQQKIKPLVLHLEEERYVKIPQLVSNVIRVDLPEKARRIYNEMEEDMIATLEDGQEVVAVNAAVASGKCAQAANGGLYSQDAEVRSSLGGKREWILLHDTKTEAIVDLVEELQGSPLLVCYEYEHDLERLKAAFKNLAWIGGGVPVNKMKSVEKAWNAGELDVLAGQPQAIAHGLNLQYGGCHNVAFYGIPWNYELYDQFIRRVRRQGNKFATVVAHHIVASDTVDAVKMQVLRRRERGQCELLAALRTYIRGKRK